jgi:hypothetical protein
MDDRAVIDDFTIYRIAMVGNAINKRYVEKADLRRYIYAEEGANQHV